MWNLSTVSILIIAMENSSIEDLLWLITQGFRRGRTLINLYVSPINLNAFSLTNAKNYKYMLFLEVWSV